MGWIRRTRALFNTDKMSKEWQEELDFHLSMREQLNLEQGMPSREAHRDARILFGGTASLLERMREIDVFTLPGSIWQDACYGARMLKKQPGFSAIAVLALTLGISLNTTVLTGYKAIVKRSLDARDPARMVNWTTGTVRVHSTASLRRPGTTWHFQALAEHPSKHIRH